MGDAGVDLQPGQCGLDAKDVLAHIHKGPCGRAGQPAVFRLAEGRGITACHHLAVDIWLGVVDLADVLNVCRTGLFVDLKRAVAVADYSFGTADPRVVVAEDTGVLLVARGIAGNLAQLKVILGVSGLQQHNAVLGVELVFHALQGGYGFAGVYADACHDAHTLRLDEDLAFLAFLTADHMAKGVVGAAEPAAVPAGSQHGLFHLCSLGAHGGGLVRVAGGVQNLGKGVAVFDIHTGDEHAFSHRAVTRAGGLEALARLLAETVQVQAVIPVGAADQRQAVRPLVGVQVAEAAAQMLKQRLCKAVVVVKVHRLVQNRVVTRFAQVGVHGGNQPQRVIVEAGADIHVALFRQRLVLVVGAAIGELGGGNVQNTLPRTGGDQMHKAEQILTGIAEAHAAAGAALIIAGRTAHVEGDHTLVLVPDIDHAVELFIAALDRVGGQQGIPVVVQFGKRRIDLRIRGIAGCHRLGAGLIDDAGRGPLLILRVFDIAQNKNQAAAFAGLQSDIDLMYANGCPTMRHRVGAAAVFHDLGVRIAAPCA